MERKELIRLARHANKLNLSNPDIDPHMMSLNRTMEGYSIEAVRGYTWNNYFTDICALYVNMGDTYTLTILYDVCRARFVVATWGDWVEKYQNKYGIE